MRLALLIFAVAIAGCGKTSSDSAESPTDQPAADGTDGTNTDNKTPGNVDVDTDPTGVEGLSVTALTIPAMLPPVVANTPGALAITTSLAATEYQINCADNHAYDNCAPGPDQKACTFIADVKCRFFGKDGPTQIKQILGNLDMEMSKFQKMSQGQYVPCLDVGNKDGVTIKDGEADRTFPKYESVAFDTKFTCLKDKNGADKTLDLGFKFELNCLSFNDEAKTGWSALGIKKNDADKNVYTVSSMGSSPQGRNGSVGTIDEDNNIEYWGIVSQVGKTTNDDLNMSNALIHLKSNAAAKTIELSFAGKNVGPDCGMRMITNKTYAFAEANTNSFGHCDADDAGYAAIDDAQHFCLKLDGENPAVADPADCDAANLKTASFTRAALASHDVLPFEIYKLFPVPQGVPEYKFVSLPKPAEGEPDPG